MKRATEDEMVEWHDQLNGHELGQTLGDDEGQGSLVCCSPWGSQRIRHDLATSLSLSLGKKIQEENICISAHM